MKASTAKKKNVVAAASVKPASKKKSAGKPFKNNLAWITGILVLTFIVYVPALNNALTNWDDPTYITDNPMIRNLSFQNIKRIFTEIYFGNYQPLHILSYAIEYHFYKLNPAGYHTTSVIMHVIVTYLVYRFIFLLSGNNVAALITALLFGIHPMHVESVAWAAERKDLLYSIFFLASLNVYIRYARNEKISFLLYSFLLFALSIFSKAMASSLPPVLILIDIFLSRKFKWKLVFEKIPFFALAITMGLVSVITVSTTGQVSLEVYTLFERILFANFNLLEYIAKLILPIKLSAYYPYPPRVNGGLPFYYYAAPFIVLLLLFLIIRSFKKSKVIFFSAGFFVACIFLVLQLLPVGPTIISERYVYLPSIAFFFLIAWYIDGFIKNKSSAKFPVFAALSGYSLFLCITTYQRCDVWKDSISLWNNVLEQFPHVGTALNNRGNIYGKEKGDLDKAMEDFNASILFEPGYENAYANRGIVYCMRGKFDLALKDFNKAVQLKPGYFDALFNRGILFTQTHEYDKAIADFDTLLKQKPEDARIFSNKGWAELLSGKTDEAIADFNKAILLDNNFAEAYYRRSNAFYNKKLYKEAYSDIQQVSALGMNVDPKYFETIKKASEGTP